MRLSKARSILVSAAIVMVAQAVGVDAKSATCRKVAGVITAVDAASMSISPQGKPVVTGKIDSRTKVVIDGQQARTADLQITYNAKGQLCLDDVWTLVTADSH